MRFKEYFNECELYEAQGQNVEYGLEALKLALDTWGLEPTTGWIGDASSGTISLGQAIYKGLAGKPGAANHMTDAAISAISIVPFGDIVKLLKFKYGAKYGTLAAKFARPIKDAAKNSKTAMTANRTTTVVSGPFAHQKSHL